MTRDAKKIVDLPKAEVDPEERARRLKVEVERLANLPPVEWMLYLSEGVAEKHGVDRADMKEMIEATIKAREKKAGEDKAEDRQREQRAEKKQTAARRESSASRMSKDANRSASRKSNAGARSVRKSLRQ
jgi:hypothetical protein